MRVNSNTQFPVISSKQQVTSPQSQVHWVVPLMSSRLQGEILKLHLSSFQQTEIPQENLKVMVHCPILAPMNRFFITPK